MRVGSWIAGAGAYFGLMMGMALAMWIAGRLAARLLGAKDFRWFREPELPTPWWKLVAVRIAAALAPWGVSVALFWLSFVTDGVVAPRTTQVEVFPDGGASRGGMLTGDRVLSIGGKSVKTWEALRAAVPQKDDPVAIALERDGKRLDLMVTPKRGRIGVSPQLVRERMRAFDAVARALGSPWFAAKAYAVQLVRISIRQQEPDLRGPVGIMRETSKARGSGSLLEFLALLAACFAAFFSGVPLFDLATSWLFRWRHPAADPATRQHRLLRCREAVLVGGVGYIVLGVLLSIAGAGVSALLLVIVPFSVVWMAMFPLIWAGGSLVWGRGRLVLLMSASTLVPCAILFVAIALHRELGRAIVEEGGGRAHP
jgi:membrane-associated protease RseP (regulator of RpoE activity)